MHGPLRVELLGRLQIRRDDEIIARFRTQKTAALLGHLALGLDRAHARDHLLALLWPEEALESARNRLSTALSSLRRQLEPPGVPTGGVLMADRYEVRLNPTVCSADVSEFEAALRLGRATTATDERGNAFARALDLYHGELMPGLTEEWILPERRRLADEYLEAARSLVRQFAAERQFERALHYAHLAVQADPLRERSHRDLIRLYAAAGRPAIAIEQYRELERLFRERLDAAPSGRARQLVEELGIADAECQRGKDFDGKRRAKDETPKIQPPGDRELSPSSAVLRTDPTPNATPRTPDADEPPGSLPLQFTRLYGREEQIELLQGSLMPEFAHIEWEAETAGCSVTDSAASPQHFAARIPHTRLLTLTGPGGSGKTRLAIAVAARLRPVLNGGAWFVSLADLSDPRQMAPAIRDALRLPRAADNAPLDQVVTHLAGQQVLLVLDNCEHLLPEAAGIAAALLQRLAPVRILATSRQPLALPGEQEFAVPPLPAPVCGPRPVTGAEGRSGAVRESDSDLQDPSTQARDRTPKALLAFPSVQLFVDRARARRVDFQLTEGNAAAVAQLCDRLEGIPLAIELAAGWAKALTPAQMLSRLSERFELLATRRAHVPERHRSLHAALEWSQRLLSPELQRFFARLSVFRGGCTLEAAEAVCGERQGAMEFWSHAVMGSGDPTPATSPARFAGTRAAGNGPDAPSPRHIIATDFLSRLVDRSLVVPEERAGEMRYRLLETVREFAGEQLPAEEHSTLQQRHARYFLGIAETARPLLSGPDQAAWLGRLEAEHDNLRAALAWSAAPVEGSEFRVQRSAEGTRDTEGHRSSLGSTGGSDHHSPAPTEPRTLNPEPLPVNPREVGLRLAAALGPFWRTRGYLSEGRGHLTTMLACAASDDCDVNPGVRARALQESGTLAFVQGDYAAARGLGEAALANHRQSGDPRGVAAALNLLGNVAHKQNDNAAAGPLYTESLTIWEEIGDPLGTATALGNLGNVAKDLGDYQLAQQRYQQSLRVHREIENQSGVAICLYCCGVCAMLHEDLPAAEAQFQEALRLYTQLGSRGDILYVLHDLAVIRRLRGDREGAMASIEEQLAIARELGQTFQIANACLSLARIALDAGDRAAARSYLRELFTVLVQHAENCQIADCFLVVALLALADGTPGRAARLLAAREALLDTLSFRPEAETEEFHRNAVARARAALSESTFARTWSEGGAMGREEALSLAQETVAQPSERASRRARETKVRRIESSRIPG
jgi:predicted ATPase/DNA-binding SARP family transcriptional activator